MNILPIILKGIKDTKLIKVANKLTFIFGDIQVYLNICNIAVGFLQMELERNKGSKDPLLSVTFEALKHHDKCMKHFEAWKDKWTVYPRTYTENICLLQFDFCSR